MGILSIRLDRRLESTVRRLARQQRKSRSEVARDALRLLERSMPEDPAAMSAADLWAPFLGCVDSLEGGRGTREGDAIRRDLVRKKRAGRL